jgi:flavin-dependent dehydrogenase
VSLGQVVVVGVSAAGLTAAETLRREGYTGRLTLVGEEDRPPYDRPPLSKQVLSGTWEPERTALRREADLTALDVDAWLGRFRRHLRTPGAKRTYPLKVPLVRASSDVYDRFDASP